MSDQNPPANETTPEDEQGEQPIGLADMSANALASLSNLQALIEQPDPVDPTLLQLSGAVTAFAMWKQQVKQHVARLTMASQGIEPPPLRGPQGSQGPAGMMPGMPQREPPVPLSQRMREQEQREREQAQNEPQLQSDLHEQG